MIISFSFVLFSKLTPVMSAEDNEVLYLADTLASADNKSALYRVVLDSKTNKANLELLVELTGYDNVNAITASLDGKKIYLIDSSINSASRLAVYDVYTKAVTDVGLISGLGIFSFGDLIDQVVVSPKGTLYITTTNSDSLWFIDTNTAAAASIGKVKTPAGVILDIADGDLAFTTDGQLFMWTVNSKPGAPAGLYQFIIPLDPAAVLAEFIGPVDTVGLAFTGLAVRDNGAGDLVGSERTSDSIYLLDKTTGALSNPYRMYLNSKEYAYTYGDMTAGSIVGPLQVTKTAIPSFSKIYDWTIEKTSTTSELTLDLGATAEVNYNVALSTTFTYSDYAVSGEIIIYNPNTASAYITDIIDEGATIVCPGIVFPTQYVYPLGSKETLICTYSMNVQTDDDFINTVEVITYPETIVPGNIATANVVFDTFTKIVNECVTITDDKYLELNQVVCADDEDKSIQYNLEVGPYNDFGIYNFENIATYTSGDTLETSSDFHTITVTVPPEDESCTLTPGYWKTHSFEGPASCVDNWGACIAWGGQENNILYSSSGLSMYEILWTPPKGSAWFTLAYQNIAAWLNHYQLGASMPPKVYNAFIASWDYLNTYSLSNVADKKFKQKSEFIKLTKILSDYNNGITGPGHCQGTFYEYE